MKMQFCLRGEKHSINTQKFKRKWALMFPYCVPAVKLTNERPATPHTFLLTFTPPHFPSTHTHTHTVLTLTSPWWLSFTPTSALLLPNLLSAVRHQPALGFSISNTISMQQTISGIWTHRHRGGVGRDPPYLWCHQIKRWDRDSYSGGCGGHKYMNLILLGRAFGFLI